VSRTMRCADATPDAVEAWRERAVRVLADEMERSHDIRQHADIEPWVEHARELCGSVDGNAMVDLQGWVARYDFERGAYSLARSGYERQLQASKRVLGEEHPATLTSMGNLAPTLRNQGDLPGARRLEERVLEIRKRVLGEEHPDTLTSISNLAGTLWNQGDLPGARRLQEAVLETMKRVLGKEHPTTLMLMSNFAHTLQSQGDLPAARRLGEAVLETRTRVLGEHHPDTLTSMNNLVWCANLFCTYVRPAPAALARVTLARMSDALAVQMKGFGFLL
jgi:hypothetical protein